ncbi:MAG: hypothetical protein Q7S92_06905 [Candidatus Diapherotrites archaeon]|nr:hypothetical protein [Candidatus Diapherotrites archaeon]
MRKPVSRRPSAKVHRIARMVILGSLAGANLGPHSAKPSTPVVQRAGRLRHDAFLQEQLKARSRGIEKVRKEEARKKAEELERQRLEEVRIKKEAEERIARKEKWQKSLETLKRVTLQIRRTRISSRFMRQNLSKFKKYLDENARALHKKMRKHEWETGGVVLIERGKVKMIDLPDPEDTKIRGWLAELKKGNLTNFSDIRTAILERFEREKVGARPSIQIEVDADIEEAHQIQKELAEERNGKPVSKNRRKSILDFLKYHLDIVGRHSYSGLANNYLIDEAYASAFDEQSDSRYFGSWHVHTLGSPASKQDIQGSTAWGPKIVFSPTRTGMKVHILQLGRVTNTYTYTFR